MNLILTIVSIIGFTKHTQATEKCSEIITQHCKCGQMSELYKHFSEDQDSIVCDGDKRSDFERVFRRLSGKLKKRDRKFDNFKLDNPTVEELGPNTTGLIKFSNIIEINATNIKRIHSKAFIGTAKEVKELEIGDSMDKYKSRKSPYNFFKMIASMRNLKHLRVKSPIFDLLPAKAFKSNRKLYWIEINFGNDRNLPKYKLKIEDRVFYHLNSLYAIQLKNLYIDRVSEKMFEMKSSSSEKELNIDLARNNLKSDSFEIGCFEHFKRPTKLYISMNSGIKYLDKRIFKPFFDANEKNILDVYELPLECQHKRNAWWAMEEKYKSRMKEVECPDKKRDKKKKRNSKKEKKKVKKNFKKEEDEEEKNQRGEVDRNLMRGLAIERTIDLDDPSGYKPEDGANKFGCRALIEHGHVCTCKWHDLAFDTSDPKDHWYMECHENVTFHFDDKLSFVFQILAKRDGKERRFKGFSFKNANFHVLDRNITGILIFKDIIIDAPNLERIHWQAFVGTAKEVRKFEIGESMKKYRSQDKPFNFFDLVNTMVNLEKLKINYMFIDIILGMTLKLPKLKYFSFSSLKNSTGKTTKKTNENSLKEPQKRLEVEDNAFYNLSNLTEISLTSVKLNKISVDAFKSSSKPKENLTIQLSHNELTGNSFQVGCFKHFHESTELWIDGNQITYLDERVFKPFLDGNENEILAVGVPFDHQDSRNFWWLYDESEHYCKKITIREINFRIRADRGRTTHDCPKPYVPKRKINLH